jgi:hypothetical protein
LGWSTTRFYDKTMNKKISVNDYQRYFASPDYHNYYRCLKKTNRTIGKNK